MIPITVLNKKGEVVGTQAFNDNLTTVEQINRALLATIYSSQLELTNTMNEYDRLMGAGKYDDAKLTAINTAAQTLHKSVLDAINTFKTAIQL